VKVGIIGGGLIGREVASALARWFALTNMPVRAELVAVCDTDEARREWFRQVPTVRQITADYHQLLSNPDVDVVYVAVPHNLHEQIYVDALSAGKDLLAEKPFGIDLAAAERIAQAVGDRFVRCSSEFPFFPGAQRVIEEYRRGQMGRLLEVRVGFLHSSDLDPTKPVNWKRQSATCGEIGVLGDLGLHVAHVPLRLGLMPTTVYAQLQKGYPERPDGKGDMTLCDTWDNATLSTNLADGTLIRFEMKRLAPGETNTWYLEILGTDSGARFSTREPKTVWLFSRGTEQSWQRIDLGHQSVLPTITGGIFEFGFPDCMLQMWGAFALEREGLLGDRFGCATVEEAVLSQRLWVAALESQQSGSCVATD